ncbi:MAG: hypothetical protein M3467_10770 [Actinomycetota bacterium]|nr:hypothetical protein [Actinomycetota bacterium]
MKVCGAPECAVEFEPKRSTAAYCSATCRSRAARARKAAAESVEADARAGHAEHELVTAVRTELAAAAAVNTFNGQLALQLARKVAQPDETGVTALSKELRAVMAAAVDKRPTGEDPAPPAESEDDDEVTAARRARAEARAAAGLG